MKSPDQIAAEIAARYINRSGGGFLLKPYRGQLIARIRRQITARSVAPFTPDVAEFVAEIETEALSPALMEHGRQVA